MLYITYAVDNRFSPDLLGLKEALALDAERFGDVKGVEVREDRPEQISFKDTEGRRKP